MPKRSLEDKIEHYMKKMEKLKEKHRRKRRRLAYSSCSDQEVVISNNKGDDTDVCDVLEPQPQVIVTEPEYGQNGDPTPTLPAPQESAETSDPPLDPEILSALGEATDQGPIWGPPIHQNLSSLWQPLLKKGMDRESREILNKKYLCPSNCSLLQAPKLNVEISAAVAEMVRLRDKKVETSQQQLGIGVTAISRAMSILLTTDNKVEAVKVLSDGCRILCDLHNRETQARMKMITPGLAKPFLNVIQDSERDETLFGTSLPEKIKASKTIEKQGLQIKKLVQSLQPRPTMAQQNTTSRQSFQGNWSGPPRYPTNRGGRGGQRRSTMRRPLMSLPPTTTQPRANQGRTRAPTRQ